MGKFDYRKEYIEGAIIEATEKNRELSSPENKLIKVIKNTTKEVVLKDKLVELFGSKELYEEIEYVYDLYRATALERDSGDPKIVHPLCVAYAAKLYNLDNKIIKVALWHDVFEDMEEWYKKMGQEYYYNEYLEKDLIKRVTKHNIWSYVNEITERKDKIGENIRDAKLIQKIKLENYQKYISRLVKYHDDEFVTLYVKLLDRTDNTYTIEELLYTNLMKNLKKNSMLLEDIYYLFGKYRISNDILQMKFDDIPMDKLNKIEKLNLMHNRLDERSLFELNKKIAFYESYNEKQYIRKIREMKELKSELEEKSKKYKK